jgi:hypothetical protein
LANFPGKFITESKDIWFIGPNGLLIDDAGELPFFECKGALSVFNVDYPNVLNYFEASRSPQTDKQTSSLDARYDTRA